MILDQADEELQHPHGPSYPEIRMDGLCPANGADRGKRPAVDNRHHLESDIFEYHKGRKPAILRGARGYLTARPELDQQNCCPTFRLVETRCWSVLRAQSSMPLKSKNYRHGADRPCTRHEDISSRKNYNHLRSSNVPGFRSSERTAGEEWGGKTQEIKLCCGAKRTNPNVEKSIFRAIHGVQLDTFPGFKTHGQAHSFLETYAAALPDGVTETREAEAEENSDEKNEKNS